VAREGANSIIKSLRGLGLDASGSIAVESVDIEISQAARRANRAAPGEGSDAVIWEEVASRTHDDATLSVTYLLFLTIATMIAAVGVLLDNPILIVGSMVVGPEFGPLAGVCVGLVQGRRRFAWRASLGLIVGFPVAILATVVFAWALDFWEVVAREQLEGERPLTAFIYQPDALSWVVAFLAGIAGMLSLTSAKSGALVGVLISVTTVPAAANVALALAFSDYPEARGSLIQLAINPRIDRARGLPDPCSSSGTCGRGDGCRRRIRPPQRRRTGGGRADRARRAPIDVPRRRADRPPSAPAPA
jgi:uncharacterized hydrophobic protein (TIGR00271 family)